MVCQLLPDQTGGTPAQEGLYEFRGAAPAKQVMTFAVSTSPLHHLLHTHEMCLMASTGRFKQCSHISFDALSDFLIFPKTKKEAVSPKQPVQFCACIATNTYTIW